MPYLNSLGQPMPESASGPGVFGSSAGGETLTAPTGPSVADGGGGGDLLIGSSGDNTFYVKDSHDVVQVAGGLSGVKTVVAFTSYTLPANVQNLTSQGTYNFAAGNSLGNLIVVGNDGQMIYGAGGADVLVGGAGADSFIVKAGEGSDVIYNFAANDTVRLIGTGLASFTDVRGAMSQAGADVSLRLSAGEQLLFRNATIGQFTDRNFLLGLDRSKLGGLTFSDNFDSFQQYDFSKDTGVWRTNFGAGPLNADTYQLTANGELQAYVDTSFQGTGDHALGYNPFSVSGGVLTITARQFAPADLGATFGTTYASGMIDTRGLFEQKYGYFEIRAAMPTALGSWPAFWMVPDPNTGGAVEADIAENLATNPQVDFVRAYDQATGTVAFANALKTGDPTGFHTYGMLWTPTTTTFYYDDTAVMSLNTPAGWNQPMYLIANYAIGGFGLAPNAAQFPDSLKIDYIRAYALADGSSTATVMTPLAPWGTVKVSGGTIDVTAGGPQLAALHFDADGAALSSRQVLNLAGPPGGSAASYGKAMLFWTDSGAAYAAYSDGASIGPAKVLMAGGISTFKEIWLTSGKVAVTWLQSDGGVQHAWAGIIDPATMTFTRQMLGNSSGGIALTATATGGYAISWHDGAQIFTRAYDGYESYGPVTDLPGDIRGVDASGKLVVTYADGQGHTLEQLYTVSVNPNAGQSAPSHGATAGDDNLTAGPGASEIHAAAGNDTIDASAYPGTTYLRGDEGNDVINGGSAFDDINGNMGNDTAHGNAGDDWVVGGKDDDKLFGDAGGDVVWGNLGNDTLDGGDGADQVRGGQGDDIVQGGAGNDYISGDRGNDTVTGGAGADRFHYFADTGIDRVTDFNAAEGDRVMLDPGTTYTTAQQGADTVITVTGGQMILVGVQLSTLQTGWIYESWT